MTRRYVVFGAGAVGGVIGATPFEHGHDVVLIARGEHLSALRTHGLRLRQPDRTVTHAIPAVGSPDELGLGADDVVILAMKSQHTAAAIEMLARHAPPTTNVVCAQNGVENERIASRSFEQVYAMAVVLPATHLVPGEVIQHSRVVGTLDLGLYPRGLDHTAEQICADLNASGLSSSPQEAVMRAKYGKLLTNLGNIIDAACGSIAWQSDILAAAYEEGARCLDAAGIEYETAEEQARRAPRAPVISCRGACRRRRVDRPKPRLRILTGDGLSQRGNRAPRSPVRMLHPCQRRAAAVRAAIGC